MGELGADPEELRDLAATMRAESKRIEASIKRVTGSVRGSSWRGRDAERFGGTWNRYMLVIRSATGRLEDAAEDLERNAVEQLRASEPAARLDPTDPVQPGVEPTVDTSSLRYPESGMGLPPTSSMESTGRDPGPPPFGDPLPLQTESWEIGGALAAGLGVSGTARLTVEELPGGRSVVWLEDIDAATASAGVSVDVGVADGPGLELGADAGSELAVHTRDAWYVDSDDVPGLLGRLGLRELIGAGTLSPGVPDPPGRGLGNVLEGVSDFLGFGVPKPAVSERLVTLGGTAGVSAAVGIPLLGASGAVAEAVGIRERGGNLALVVGASGGYSTKFPGGGPTGGESIELEIPVDGRDAGHMVITTTEKVDGGETMERAVYRFDGDEAARHIQDAARAVGSGDVESAGDALAALWKDVELRSIWSDAMGGVVNNDVRTLDLGVALGADLSGSVTGGRRIVTYQR